MPNANAQRIAEALAKAKAQAQALGGQQGEPGLESPFEQRLLENAGLVAGGYGLGKMGGGVAKILASRGVPALQELGQAGAIFPESTPLAGYSRQELKELEDVLSPSQMNYRRNEAMANWHGRNEDFPRVLKDKWAMLVHHHGS